MQKTATRKSFEQTFVPLFDCAYRAALFLTKNNEDDAADLTQETFLRVFKGWRNYVERGSPKAFLMKALNNTFFTFYQGQKRRPQCVNIDVLSENGFEPAAPETSFPSVESHSRCSIPEVMKNILLDDLYKAFMKIPPNFQLPLFLREVEDMRYNEIAAVLNLKIGTVKFRIFRARAILRKHFIPRAICEVISD